MAVEECEERTQSKRTSGIGLGQQKAQPKSASSIRRKPPVVQTDRPRLTLRTRRDVADWERGVLRAPQSPVKDLKDDPYPTRSLVKRSISRRGVTEPKRSWSDAPLGTRAEARKQRPPSRQKGAYPTHLETESTETDSPPPSPVKRPATASRQRRASSRGRHLGRNYRSVSFWTV